MSTTGASYISDNIYPQAIIWNWDKFEYNREPTGAVAYLPDLKNTFIHSRVIDLIWEENADILRNIQTLNDNRFIQLEKKFKEQYDKLREAYGDNSYEYYKGKFSKSLPSLMTFNPDKITLQLTNEKSIFFTLFKGNKMIYIEHFLESSNDEDESVLTIFEKDIIVFTFAGTFPETINELNDFISPEKQIDVEFLVDELSY